MRSQRRASSFAGAPGGRSALEEGLALAGLLSQGGLSLTLEVEGAVAGHLMVRRLHQRLGDDEGEIAIAVHNSARGVGLGRMLMDTAIDWARVVRIRRLPVGRIPEQRARHPPLPLCGLRRKN